MEFNQSYLTEQIIAYIGNKRKLLPLIYKAVQNTGLDINQGLSFFDVFSGSGVVSRLAKSLGFEVFSNDWEYYSFIINQCYLATDKSELTALFGSEEEFSSLLSKINSLKEPSSEDQYIARYYSPKEFDINEADYRTERLFYTRSNALAIDKIRNYIEENYPSDSSDKDVIKRRNVLLAVLIYEAATHTNTSGVFKAFHKGFGGHNKDALKRILGEIKLYPPVLIDSKRAVHVFCEDANELVKKIKGLDIAYLDPPYNQHQYGSNYHMLNTLARWDRIPFPCVLNDKGVLKEKAAIRHDWTDTKSMYCYKVKADIKFEQLIENLDAKHILISYSTDGIIPFERMREICLKKGKVSIVTNEYTTYRGGKQSNERRNSNIEFILCIDTTKKSDSSDLDLIDSILERKKLLLLFKQKFCLEKLNKLNFTYCNNEIKLFIGSSLVTIKSKNLFTLSQPENASILTLSELKVINSLLGECVCKSKEEELQELLLRVSLNDHNSIRFAKMLPPTLKKLAYKKNKEAFLFYLNEIKKLKEIDDGSVYSLISEKLDSVESIARLRFLG